MYTGGMCFSAPASFIAAGGLAVIGTAALKVAPKKQKILAVMPLLFAVQQALEGIQWLALNRGTTCPLAGYGFLSLALLWWPIYVPVMVLLLDRGRRPLLWGFVCLGGALAVFFASIMVTHPLRILVSDSRIIYSLSVPMWTLIAVIYVGAVCGALLASRLRALRWYGVLLFISGGFTLSIALDAGVSVWCYFSAIVSGFIYLAIRNRWLYRT